MRVARIHSIKAGAWGLCFVFAGSLMSCASTHPGRAGQSDKNQLPLVVSAEIVDSEAEDAFQLVEVTIENTGPGWVRIHKAEVPISDPAATKTSVVIGQDLKDWANAMEVRLKKDKHNREMLQAALFTLGAVTTVASGDKNPGLATAGAAVATGTYAWAVADTVRASIRAAEGVEAIPENHLYHPVSIPGKMFMRRWILINKPPGTMIRNFYVELESVEGEKDGYAIRL